MYLDEKSSMLLFTNLLIPHLKYAAQIWNLSLKKDINKLERVQYKATKIQKINDATMSG